MANINIRIDNIVKQEAEMVFANLGLSASAAITLFYKQVIRTQSIPFKLKAEVPNRKTRKALKELEKMEKHPERYKKYSSINELEKDLFEK